jgi:hypothetical protein
MLYFTSTTLSTPDKLINLYTSLNQNKMLNFRNGERGLMGKER